jgi:hypothetical protein
MLTENEKELIKEAAGDGEPLSAELKSKLLEVVKNETAPSADDDQSDYLCCDLGIDQPSRYQWTTFDNCRALGGSAASNSMCGH